MFEHTAYYIASVGLSFAAIFLSLEAAWHFTACKIHDKPIKPCFYKQIGILKQKSHSAISSFFYLFILYLKQPFDRLQLQRCIGYFILGTTHGISGTRIVGGCSCAKTGEQKGKIDLANAGQTTDATIRKRVKDLKDRLELPDQS